jgi:hypothetical protein
METALGVYGKNIRTTLPDEEQAEVIQKIQQVRAKNLMVWNKDQVSILCSRAELLKILHIYYFITFWK